jgi:hypothetical protein
MKKQELQTTQKQELSNNVNTFDAAQFIDGGITKEDVRIGKLLITQAMSTDAKKANKELREGDVYLSQSFEKMSSQGEQLEFIPIYIEKLVQTFQNQTRGLTYETAKAGDWIDTQKAKDIKDTNLISEDFIRVKVMAMFAYFLKGSSILPQRLDFKKSSALAFQPMFEKIVSLTEQNPNTNQLHYVFTAETKEKTNKKGSFYVWEIKFKRKASEQETLNAVKLADMVKTISSETIYDDSDELENAAPF